MATKPKARKAAATTPKRMGRPPHIPTDVQRLVIAGLVSLGHTNDVIAEATKIPRTTLKHHYAHELKHGRQIIHARIGGNIVQQALDKESKAHVTMAIFYAKSQMGWRDRHSHAFEKPDGSVADPVEMFTINITG